MSYLRTEPAYDLNLFLGDLHNEALTICNQLCSLQMHMCDAVIWQAVQCVQAMQRLQAMHAALIHMLLEKTHAMHTLKDMHVQSKCD